MKYREKNKCIDRKINRERKKYIARNIYTCIERKQHRERRKYIYRQWSTEGERYIGRERSKTPDDNLEMRKTKTSNWGKVLDARASDNPRPVKTKKSNGWSWYILFNSIGTKTNSSQCFQEEKGK